MPLASSGNDFIAPTAENAVNGTYPLTRFLYIYVNKQPNKSLPPLEREFIKMVLSRAGQMVVVKDGYVPLPAKVAAKQLAIIDAAATN